MSTLLEKYKKEVIPVMQKKFGLRNAMAVPRIEKVTLNTGIGRFLKDAKILEDVERDLARIAGQKPVRTRARQAVSGFKIRKGQEIGFKVTLRNKRMWDFIERLIGIALPRTRDFRGVPESSFDKSGNLSIGIREHIVFPETAGDDVRHIFGLQAVITTTARTREHGIAFLKLLGFPIKSES